MRSFYYTHQKRSQRYRWLLFSLFVIAIQNFLELVRIVRHDRICAVFDEHSHFTLVIYRPILCRDIVLSRVIDNSFA